MPYTVALITKFLALTGSISTVLWLYFRMKDSYQTEEEKKNSQKFYRMFWEKIENIRIGELPEMTIRWLLINERKIQRFSAKLFDDLDNSDSIILRIVMICLQAIFPILILGGLLAVEMFNNFHYFFNGNPWYSGLAISAYAWLICVSFVGSYEGIVMKKGFRKNLLTIVSFIIISPNIIYALSIFLQKIMALNLPVSTFLFFILIPIFTCSFMLLVATSIESVGKIFNFPTYRKVIIYPIPILVIACGFSLFVTMLSFLFGSFFSPLSPIPKEPQMLLVNVLFDMLTLFFTLKILRWALQRGFYVILILVTFDVILAALLACLSLYIGLFSTEYSLNITEVLYVLFAKSPNGNGFQLGPYFWVMHTTFIPTIIYLSIIFLATIAKGLAIPFVQKIKKTSILDRPHYATATTFAFISGILGLIVLMINLLYWEFPH